MTTATKTKKRSKRETEAEEQAKALSGLDAASEPIADQTGVGEYGLNQHGVFTTPERIEVPLPKKLDASLTILVAFDEESKSWKTSREYRSKRAGSGGFPNKKHDGYETREKGILAQLEMVLRQEPALRSAIEEFRKTIGSGESPDVIETDLEKMLGDESDADTAAQDPPTIGQVIADGAKEIMGDEIARNVLEQIDDEHRKAKAFDQIADLNDAVDKAFTTWAMADKKSKDLKKAYEGCVSELRGFISSLAHPAPMPLFDGKSAASGEKDNANEPKRGTAEVNPTDESWRNVPLREALPDLTDSVHLKLEGAQLFTMGELANWTAESGGRRRLTDIAGIGSGTAGKIEEATMDFWKRYRPAEAAQAEAVAAVEHPEDWQRSEFLKTPITDLTIPDGPTMVLEGAKIKTVGDLESLAATKGRSIFDTLREIGLDGIEADDVIEALDEHRERITKLANLGGGL